MDKIKFTLDSLSYKYVANTSETINFVLPHRVPNKVVGTDTDVFGPAEKVAITVYVETTSGHTPTVNVEGEDETVKIEKIGGEISLAEEAITTISFFTIDGGKTWVVSANNAVTAATDPISEKLTTVEQTANTAKSTADTAKSTADTAKNTADAACPKTQAATKEALGLVKQCALVPDAAGENATKAEFNALIAALKASGIMANE